MVPTLLFGTSILVIMSQHFDDMSTIVRILYCAIWFISMIVAMRSEDKLRDRIEFLEWKLNDKENKDE